MNILKYLAFFAVLSIANDLLAETWIIKSWSSGTNKNRFTYAVNYAKDGDILQLEANIRVNSDVEIRKKITVKSKDGTKYTITNRGYTYGVKIHPGGTLTMTNVTYDCQQMSQIEDVFLLMPRTISGSTTNIARMVLNDGATIKEATLASSTRNENAVIHIKEGGVLRINSGAAILNCTNNSSPGKGGAICCDFGTVIMTGGTIAGCVAKGAGGAIHTDGTRVDNTDHYGISSRGDIYISGGYITNNTCGAGFNGGGIYLGNSGPVLHITGTAVISNNFSRASNNSKIPDDVSTYLLENAYANRLKLVNYHESNPEGFTYDGQRFTGWVGVRYPADNSEEPQQTRFGGLWEYFDGDQEEARQFFWNGDNEYRGKIDGNALVWSKHVVHELPKDGLKVAQLIESGETPIYMELNEDYKMTQPAVVPENIELFLDLKGFNLKCDFHISNDTARVTITDSSTNKTGTVTGARDSTYKNAFSLQGGSYHELPKPEWVASNCVVIGNYCTEHPYMVAIKVWDAATADGQLATDLTLTPVENAASEIREVTLKEDGSYDIGDISYSTGDWKFEQYTNTNYRVQVLAAPAIQDESGNIRALNPFVSLFDTHEQSDIAPLDVNSSINSFGNEDVFKWDAEPYGLIKLLHITTTQKSGRITTNAVHEANFRFPEAEFKATQRADLSRLPINVVDSLLTALGYNRAEGFVKEEINQNLDSYEANGLRKWENIVTGTDKNQLLMSMADEGSDGLSVNISLQDSEKTPPLSTGYDVWYDIRKYDSTGWQRIGQAVKTPSFSIPLLDEEGKSVGASGFYRISTLIIPDGEYAITNEIPSTNIVGVLEIPSSLTNTLTAVPWVQLGDDPATASQPITVSKYLHTKHLDHEDSVQVANKGHIYQKWNWDKHGKKWDSAITVTRDAIQQAVPAVEHRLERNMAVWVERKDPLAKPFFLIGQYSTNPVSLTILGTTDEESMVCTLVPNPNMQAVKVNDYNWQDNPIAGNKGDVIRIPNEKDVPLNLTWNGRSWGRFVRGVWKDDTTVPAGTGFWYMRRGEAFEISLPVPEIEE
ncbi:MAG: hypothetical protein J6S51_03500 [Kiritimatiellae bacterium]|nr:hypothetical protein [Kiritimatiellia bacterium]